MSLFKKNIILSPANYDGKSDEKGILSLQKDGVKVSGNLKCFALSSTEGKLLLGISDAQGKTYKFNLPQDKTSNFSFELPAQLDLNQKLSCVLVQIKGQEHTPVIWGSTETNKLCPVSAMRAFEEIAPKEKYQPTGREQIKQETHKKPIEIEEDPYIDEEIENLIDEEVGKLEEELLQEQSSSRYRQKRDYMPHKEAFFAPRANVAGSFASTRIKQNENDSEKKERSNTRNSDMFYDQVKDQIDALFERFSRETVLEEIIPNSRFVRVDFNGDDEHYIFGLIFDEDGVEEYIVYGIPARFSSEPPNDLQGFYQWLPLDPDKPQEDGYWLMYQSARTGENVRIEIV